ncbi:MAG: energy-coupling factor transporter transmembrane component T [Anaerolineae bacterium]
MNRSFFLPRTSGLHALHPLTKLTLVAALVLVGSVARAPFVPVALFLFVILPLAFWGQIAGAVTRVSLAILLPFLVSLILVQGLFYPGATQVLFTLGPVSFKQEGLQVALATAARILLLASSGLLLFFSTHPADLMLALTQRGLPGALAYIVVTAIQLIPQMLARSAAIADAQRARGLETEGNLLRRISAVIPLLSPLIFSALADVDERAMALEARAFSSKRTKTSYKELRDSQMQSVARWALLLGALALAGAEIAGWGP